MIRYNSNGRKFGRRPSWSSFVLLWLLAFALLPVAGLVVAPHVALAQSKSFHMDQYNSDVTVNKDGSYDVVETLVYVYDAGSFHRGTRIIKLKHLDSISNVRVAEQRDGQLADYQETSYDPDDSSSGVPGTFGTITEGSELKIRWVYDYVSNTSKTFQVGYHVTGNMRVYNDHDVLDWNAIPEDWASPIYASQVRVNLPPGTQPNQILKIDSKPSAEASKAGNTVTWAIGENSGLEVGLQLAKGVVQATEPAYQAGYDRQPLVDIGLLLLGILLTIGGVLWGIMTWYRKGRDKPVKLLSDYITAPPSDLPPGLVGTLLDESADVRDVIATVVDQGRKGNLKMAEIGSDGLFSSKDFEYTMTGQKVEYRYEEMVLNAIFSHGNPVRLSGLKNTFYNSLPPIYGEMYRSLVALKYFPENPQGVRMRNYAIGIFLLVLAGLTGFGAFALAESVSFFLLALPVAIGITGIARLATAGVMPRKTDFGAEQAEKWRAFGRYLQQMKQYTDVQAAADKFQQYLPYAVALGIERQLINQFDSVPTAMPPYYIPYGYGPYVPYPVGSAMGGGGQGAPVGDMPQFNPAQAMQGMSDSLAGAMQGMSDSFTSMVNSASSVLVSQPQSSGGSGGWGGGSGGSFGGGGGGGGGGGAD